MNTVAQTDKMLSRKEGHVGYVIFNNPERRNAVSLEMWEATARILDDFKKDNDIRVRGADRRRRQGVRVGRRHFAGSRTSAPTRRRSRVTGQTVERANTAVYEYPKPTIAMIRGYCIGGGLGLALCCDLRICSDDSRFAVPAAKLGLGYPYHGLKKLVDVVGPSFAKEIFYTARQFDAEEARIMGLVNRVVPAEELAALCEEICRHHRRECAANHRCDEVHHRRGRQGRVEARSRGMRGHGEAMLR